MPLVKLNYSQMTNRAAAAMLRRMTREQCRAARALLDWSQDELAAKSEVSVTAVRNFERGATAPMRNNLAAMQRALEVAGVLFIPENGGGPGVRLRDRGQLRNGER